MESPDLIAQKCNDRYNEVASAYAGDGSQLFTSHFGEFSQELVNSLSSTVEESMFEAGDKKGAVKRMFSVLVEGLQNIRIHGEKDPKGNQNAFVAIGQMPHHYKVTIGNLVPASSERFLREKIDFINQHDEAGVKSLYMEVLTNGVISSKGGAGLGFITMAMKSKNKLGYHIQPVTPELSFFTVEMTLDREG
jgi:hypothetical protein